jgi:exopolyphosphatase/guanosine-5'-triphosphate,3'-diphosphate pyrophosphatase
MRSTGRLPKRARDGPVVVIDIGSNSGRIVVCRVMGHGAIEIVGDSRASLRLIHDIDERGSLGAKTIGRVLRTLGDFRAVADGSGPRALRVVATAAVREASNGEALCRQIRRETGIAVEILSGAREARCAYLGAAYGLPVEDGTMLDVGGGSLQLVRFHNRMSGRSWSLPLGALRLSERFLGGGTPSRRNVSKLRAHVIDQLSRAGVSPLPRAGTLIGTGGTIRNLAKIDSRRRPYPISRLHGFEISRVHLEELAAQLTSHRFSASFSIPGLNADRADSMLGGCFVVETVMDFIGAETLIVSGQGLREGILYEENLRGIPSIETVRRASIADITSRFRTWDPTRARRRATLAASLHRHLDPDAPQEVRDMLRHAAIVLDIGRSIDYYRRHDHSATILRSTNLMGFSHREIVLISAIVEFADGEDASLKRFRPLVQQVDRGSVLRAGLVLAIADEIEHRLPPNQPARVFCQVRKDGVTIRSPYLRAWQPRSIAIRFRKLFGVALTTGAKGKSA